MQQRGFRVVTAALLLGAAALMLLSWTGLMAGFEYPQILRQAPGVVLGKFLAGGEGLRLLWVGMTASSVLLTVVILLFRRLLADEDDLLLGVGTALGVLSGLVQVVGLIRWVVVVPAIAAGWQAADPAGRVVWEAIFTVVNQYGGVAIGETLGYLFTGAWILLVGVVILGTRVFHRTAGVLSIATGVGILSGVLEQAGQGWAVGVNATAYLVLLGLFVYFGIRLLVSRPGAPTAG